MPSRYAQDETKVKFAVRIPKGMHDSFADRVTYLMENQAPEEHRGSVCAVLESDNVGRVLVIGTWDADAMEWWKGYALGALDALADRIMPDCQSERCPACFDPNEQGFLGDFKEE